MHQFADSAETRLATRLGFFAAGFGVACWAPLVPFAKANTGVGEGELGLLLLCLGIGSIIAMPLTGWIAARIGAKPMIIAGGLGLALFLPFLATASHPLALGAALLVFGASLGTIDVAVNVHAVEVETAAGKPLMSGFHGLFSAGGIVAAGGLALLLSLGVSPLAAALFGSALTALSIVLAWPRLLKARGGEPLPLVLPRGIILLLAALAGITFLVEGAVLDWGALLVVETDLAGAERAGLGYMLFSVAMTVGRLTGDRIVASLGNYRVLTVGSILTILGFAVLLLAPWPAIAFAGFALIGIGASNLVPVLFSVAGRQTVMPPALAIAAVTTTGYAGVLLGPAILGFIAHATSLWAAFWLPAALMLLVMLSAGAVTRR